MPYHFLQLNHTVWQYCVYRDDTILKRHTIHQVQEGTLQICCIVKPLSYSDNQICLTIVNLPLMFPTFHVVKKSQCKNTSIHFVLFSSFFFLLSFSISHNQLITTRKDTKNHHNSSLILETFLFLPTCTCTCTCQVSE